jgi:hypothetical protein
MRYVIIAAGWVWMLLALPQVTNADVDLGWFMCLLFTGPVIGLAWVGYSAVFPGVLRTSRLRWAWWSVPAAGVFPVVLSATGFGLVARVWLCEAELREFANAVREGRAEVRTGDPPRRVGLFWVYDASGTVDTAYLITARGFIDRYGLAYRPGLAPTDDSRHDYRHLFGPWYHYREKF